jgi:hypothetical protein
MAQPIASPTLLENSTNMPSPMVFTSTPWCSAAASRKVPKLRRRTSSLASSPIRVSSAVEPTRSQNRNDAVEVAGMTLAPFPQTLSTIVKPPTATQACWLHPHVLLAVRQWVRAHNEAITEAMHDSTEATPPAA